MAEGWLAGKRALVVGAGSGIGRAVCEAFLAEGARVGALENDAAKCESLVQAIPDAIVVAGDATVMDDNVRAVGCVTDRYGGLDILVNCVGIFDFYRSLSSIDGTDIPGSFEEVFRVNVLSHILGVKAALPAMADRGGSIVLTASTSGFHPSRGGILYVSSKFAVRGLVLSLAHELAPRIRVNGVAPGGTLGTDLRGAAALGQEGRRLDDGPERVQDLESRTPLSVALTPEDHASSYVFLASDRARGLTGTFVHPDGGASLQR